MWNLLLALLLYCVVGFCMAVASRVFEWEDTIFDYTYEYIFLWPVEIAYVATRIGEALFDVADEAVDMIADSINMMRDKDKED